MGIEADQKQELYFGKRRKNAMREREYGVDLLRFFAMFLVIAGHLVRVGGIQATAKLGTIEYYIALFLETATICSINIFGLISGYVGYGRTYSLYRHIKSLLVLWFHIVFWTFIISVIFVVFFGEQVNIDLLRITFLPITSKTYWYMTSYFIVSIFSPLLNLVVEKVDYRLAYTALFLLTVTLSVIITNSGNNAIWLILLYIYGAEIKKNNLIKISKNLSVIIFIICIIITFIFAALQNNGTIHLNKRLWGIIGGRTPGLWPSSITNLFAALCILEFGIKLRMGKRIQFYLRKLTPLVLSVYLIHVHPLVFNKLTGAFSGIVEYGSMAITVFTLVTSACIFSFCLFLDYWREILFRKLSKQWWQRTLRPCIIKKV